MKHYAVGLFIGVLLLLPLFYSGYASEEAQDHLDEAKHHHDLAIQSEQSGDFIEAAKHHHEAAQHFHEAAKAYDQDGDNENAAKYHHEAALHHHMAAESLELAGNFAESAQHHLEASKHHLMAAKQLEEVGNFEEAIEHHNEASEHFKMASTLYQTVTTKDRLHVTQLLSWKSIPANDYILLFDSTPDTVSGGHLAIKADCNENGDGMVDVLMGMAPDMKTIKLDHEKNMIHELSTHGEMCLYHIDLPAEPTMQVTDIAIINPSDERIRLGATASVTIYVNGFGQPVQHEGHDDESHYSE